MSNTTSDSRLACVTGATGLVGRHIVRQLLQRGWRVRTLSRQQGVSLNGVEWVQGDVTDARVLDRLVAGADAVFHCAAELHHVERMMAVNVEATKTLLQAAARHNVRFLCHLSSAGVVGAASLPLIDEETPCHPLSLYERTKWRAEQLVGEGIAGVEICILRPTNVIDSDKPGVLHLALRDNWRDRLQVYIKGKECAHLVHAHDVAAAALHFLGQGLKRPECFIVSCDDDDMNTVAGAYALSRGCIEGVQLTPPWAAPRWLPHTLRSIFRGSCLHGGTRFSPAKIKAAGFSFPLGLRGAITQVCGQQRGKQTG